MGAGTLGQLIPNTVRSYACLLQTGGLHGDFPELDQERSNYYLITNTPLLLQAITYPDELDDRSYEL
ncbi:MAG: hypothetical protein AAFQ02_06970 [Bacteroidota bacterium]